VGVIGRLLRYNPCNESHRLRAPIIIGRDRAAEFGGARQQQAGYELYLSAKDGNATALPQLKARGEEGVIAAQGLLRACLVEGGSPSSSRPFKSARVAYNPASHIRRQC